MDKHLAKTIDSTSYAARYDACVKELLADKQVLAYILKYSLDEFKDLEISEIIACIGEPEISKVPMEPGQTNLDKVGQSATEDSVLGEGKIYYDIRFVCYLGQEMLKFLINIEAQKSTKISLLGYHLDNRVIYYLSRMISAEKEIEFSNSDYDKIKPVRSIWICMDSKADEDSINRICLTQENVYGKMMDLPNLNKMQGVIIRIRENENVEVSKNVLISMLEELLSKEDADVKKRKLVENYGFIMNEQTGGKIKSMCNLSEVLIEKGLQRGEAKKLIENIMTLQKKLNISTEEACNLLDVSEKQYKEAIDLLK